MAQTYMLATRVQPLTETNVAIVNSFPGSGSFTRPNDKIHVGQTLLEVLKDRYVDEGKSAKQLYLGQSKIKVDVYDFDRVKETQK